MTTKQSDHIKALEQAREALNAARYSGLADKLDEARADYSAKCVALTNAARVMDQHPRPECDEHQDGDPIQCGWKQAYEEMLDALWIGW